MELTETIQKAKADIFEDASRYIQGVDMLIRDKSSDIPAFYRRYSEELIEMRTLQEVSFDYLKSSVDKCDCTGVALIFGTITAAVSNIGFSKFVERNMSSEDKDLIEDDQARMRDNALKQVFRFEQFCECGTRGLKISLR